MTTDRNKALNQYLLENDLKPNPEGLYDGIGLADFKEWSDIENKQLQQQNDELRKALEESRTWYFRTLKRESFPINIICEALLNNPKL